MPLSKINNETPNISKHKSKNESIPSYDIFFFYACVEGHGFNCLMPLQQFTGKCSYPTVRKQSASVENH